MLPWKTLIWSKVPASIKTLEFNLFKCKFKHSLICSYNVENNLIYFDISSKCLLLNLCDIVSYFKY